MPEGTIVGEHHYALQDYRYQKAEGHLQGRCCFVAAGTNRYGRSHIPNIVSYASNIPQNTLGGCLGLQGVPGLGVCIFWCSFGAKLVLLVYLGLRASGGSGIKPSMRDTMIYT